MKNKGLTDAERDVNAALRLLTTDEAEAIIGQSEEVDTLIRGVKGAVSVLWVSLNVRKTQKALHYVSSSLVIIAQIVLYAYALGMRRKP